MKQRLPTAGSLRPGAIVQVQHLLPNGAVDVRWWRGASQAIQYAMWRIQKRLGYAHLGPDVGSHDSLLIFWREQWWTGDMVFPRGRCRPWDWWVKRAEAGRVRLRLFWPTDAPVAQGLWAATWWMKHEKGNWYSWPSYAWLWATVIWHGLDLPCDPLEADYCTESVAKAWREGAGNDVYRKRKPTPFTTWKRWREGDLSLIGVVSK